MGKQYKFDNSCEFDGITKEDFLKDVNQWENECERLAIGKHICKIHPCRRLTCKDTTGKLYEEVLTEVINEFSQGKTAEDALKNLFGLYSEEFTEERLSDYIDYIMVTIMTDCDNVKKGKMPKANSYREILERNRDMF